MKMLENNYGKIRCKCYDSVYQLEKGDLQKFPYDDEWYFECPVCGAKKVFDEEHPYVKASKTGIFVHK